MVFTEEDEAWSGQTFGNKPS